MQLSPLSITALVLLYATVLADEGLCRYNSSWSVEQVDAANRIRDAIGTALRLKRLGPLRQFQVVTTLRSGPAADVLRDSIKEASNFCQFNSTHGCDISYTGAGNIGEVQYAFRDEDNSREGRSSQTMVACRCLGKECKEAVLMQPFRIHADKNISKTRFETCLYYRVRETGKLAECHTELLRLSARRRHSLEELNEDISRAYLNFATQPWVYNVTESGWLAYGQRGWLRSMSFSEYNKTPEVDLAKIANIILPNNANADEVDEHFHFAHLSEDQPEMEMEFARDPKREQGINCARVFNFASDGAAWIGTQADEIAIGRIESTYFYPAPQRTSATDLALASSAAALGTYTVWMMFLKCIRGGRTKLWNLAWVLVAQVLLYILESSPLLFTLIMEYRAENWVSQFAHFDGTLSVAKDMETVEAKTANESIYVASALIGQVKYISTNSGFVLMLFVVFTIATFSGIGATILQWRYYRANVDNGTLPPEYQQLLYLGNEIDRDMVWKAFQPFDPEKSWLDFSQSTLPSVSSERVVE